jgi:hypothetical protein
VKEGDLRLREWIVSDLLQGGVYRRAERGYDGWRLRKFGGSAGWLSLKRVAALLIEGRRIGRVEVDVS